MGSYTNMKIFTNYIVLHSIIRTIRSKEIQ
jgi:hypothetical protein